MLTAYFLASTKLVLWNADDEKIEVDPPLKEDADLLSPDVGPRHATLGLDTEGIVDRIYAATGEKPVLLTIVSQAKYIILEASLKDGTRCIIKTTGGNDTLDDERVRWVQEHFDREYSMMSWISSVSDIPLPKVFWNGVAHSRPCMITGKCEGVPLIGRLGRLSEYQKTIHLNSFARIALAMWNIAGPQGIGSVLTFPERDIATSETSLPVLGSCLDASDPDTSFAKCDSISDYFSALIAHKKTSDTIGVSEQDVYDACATLNALHARIQGDISRFDSHLLRSVPSPAELSLLDVLIDGDGSITGIINWEYHMVKPAILAATYPPWVSSEGPMADPRFAFQSEQFTRFWMESRAECRRLRGEFDEIVREQDPEYYRALNEGAFCRTAESWLYSSWPDLGCRQLRAWMDSVMI